MLRELFSKQLLEKNEARTPETFWPSMIADCPRKVVAAFRGQLAPTYTIAEYARMKIGLGVEIVEQQFLDEVLPQINSMTWLDLLDGRLKAVLADGLKELSQEHITAYRIAQVPIRFKLDGIQRTISGKTDFLVLAYDTPHVLEVKSSSYRAQQIFRELEKGHYDVLPPSWLIQIALYMYQLEMPGILHIWDRSSMDLVELMLKLHAGDLYVDDHRIRYSGLPMIKFIEKRLSYIELALSVEEDLFPITKTGPRTKAPSYPTDFPRHPADRYQLVYNKHGKPTERASYRKQKYVSYRCFNCPLRDVCYK